MNLREDDVNERSTPKKSEFDLSADNEVPEEPQSHMSPGSSPTAAANVKQGKQIEKSDNSNKNTRNRSQGHGRASTQSTGRSVAWGKAKNQIPALAAFLKHKPTETTTLRDAAATTPTSPQQGKSEVRYGLVVQFPSDVDSKDTT